MECEGNVAEVCRVWISRHVRPAKTYGQRGGICFARHASMARWLIEHDTGVLPSQEDMHAAMAESGYVAKVVGGGKLYKAKLLGKSLRKPLCD